MNWLRQSASDETFGSALMRRGVSDETLKSWCLDSSVVLEIKDPNEESVYGGIFDFLEDNDVEDCLTKCLQINENAKQIQK